MIGPARERGQIGLKHWKLSGARSNREGLGDLGDLGLGQIDIRGSRVFGRVLEAGGFGYREERRAPNQEPERDLASGRVMRGGDLL